MNLEALMALAKSKKSAIAARSNFNNLVKPPPGKSKWRILPGWRKDEPQQFWHDFGQHYIKDRDGNVKVVYVCETDTFGRECGVCDYLADLIRSTKDDETLKALKELKSRQSHIVNAIRLDGADADPKKPVLLNIGGGLLGEYLTNLATYQNDDDINILDPKEGRAVNIERTGTGLTTKYSLNVAGKSEAVDPAALSNLIDIDAYIEGERAKGVTKGTALLESTTKSILGYAAPRTPMLGTSGSVSRVIDADTGSGATWAPATSPKVVEAKAEEVTVELSDADVEAEVAATEKTVAPKTAPKATPVAAASKVDDVALGDDELAKILAELG